MTGPAPDPEATIVQPSAAPDPEATVAGPAAALDPEATVTGPAAALDPEATVTGPAAALDPEATVTRLIAEPDAETTLRGPIFLLEPESALPVPALHADPDATVVMPCPAEPDAGVALPTPGRRRNPFAPRFAREAIAADVGGLGGLNPLIAAANPILAAVPQIRQALRHPDPKGLREMLRDQIEAFEAQAGVAGFGEEAVTVARYALCALLDETAAATPWGGGWAEEGLLRDLHAEHRGGEKFFQLLAKMLEDPGANAELLEFFHVCLALGYEGHSFEGGKQELEDLRAKLAGLVRARHPRPDGELSERWRGARVAARKLPHALWLSGAGSTVALALLALYLGYSASLGVHSDPVARGLAQLKPPAVAAQAAAALAAPAARGTRVSSYLAADIARGLVAVTETGVSSSIVIRSDRLFSSGSARIEAGVQPILLRIAEALERVPGTILVTGHTDDLPIRSARFPSNWELSAERARTVVKLMAPKLSDPARLKAEGLADSDPVAPNDSEANRARNRRVVIILKAAT